MVSLGAYPRLSPLISPPFGEEPGQDRFRQADVNPIVSHQTGKPVSRVKGKLRSVSWPQMNTIETQIAKASGITPSVPLMMWLICEDLCLSVALVVFRIRVNSCDSRSQSFTLRRR